MSIHDTLKEWLKDPSIVEDDGLTPPTDASISIAFLWLRILDPTRVIPDGVGGVSFLWTPKQYRLNIDNCGSLTFHMWSGTTMLASRRWKVEGRVV